MPSLSEISPLNWLRMELSTMVTTYAVMDALSDRGDLPSRASWFPSVVARLKEARWVEEVRGELQLTQAGRDHLRQVG